MEGIYAEAIYIQKIEKSISLPYPFKMPILLPNPLIPVLIVSRFFFTNFRSDINASLLQKLWVLKHSGGEMFIVKEWRNCTCKSEFLGIYKAIQLIGRKSTENRDPHYFCCSHHSPPPPFLLSRHSRYVHLFYLFFLSRVSR